MPSAATPLLDEIKRRFYPFVRGCGFVRARSADPHFVAFRRQAAGRTDVFEIQWDKYWRPRFVLNIERGERDAGTDAARLRGRLQRCRGGSLDCWFGLHRSWRSRIRSGCWRYTPSEVADELIAAFGELERWWAGGEAGPHVQLADWPA